MRWCWTRKLQTTRLCTINQTRFSNRNISLVASATLHADIKCTKNLSLFGNCLSSNVTVIWWGLNRDLINDSGIEWGNLLRQDWSYSNVDSNIFPFGFRSNERVSIYFCLSSGFTATRALQSQMQSKGLIPIPFNVQLYTLPTANVTFLSLTLHNVTRLDSSTAETE